MNLGLVKDNEKSLFFSLKIDYFQLGIFRNKSGLAD